MVTTLTGVRQQARAARTREHIVRAALATFVAKGYVETSMDDICTAAGCSKGGLYHHFKAKESVLEVVTEMLSRHDGLFPPAKASAEALQLDPLGLSRLVVDIWAEAARRPALATRIAASGTALDHADAYVRLGMVVQSVTQEPAVTDTRERAA